MIRSARSRFVQRLATVGLMVVIASVVFQPQSASAAPCAGESQLRGTNANLSLDSEVRKARPASEVPFQATVTRAATGTPAAGFEIWIAVSGKKQTFYGYGESDAEGRATITVTIPKYARAGWYDVLGNASKSHGRVCHRPVVEEKGSTALDRFLRIL
jgi:hypothetical protein